MKSVFTFMFAASALFLLAACSGTSTPSADVVARVNGIDVTVDELDQRLAASLVGVEPAPEEEEITDLRLQLLTEMIGNEILLQLAADDQLTATDAEVDVEFNDFKNQYSEERFEEVLSQQEMTTDNLREQLRMSLTIDKLLNKEITSKISGVGCGDFGIL